MNLGLRRHLREARENRLVVASLRLAFKGDEVRCPCCASSFRRFRSFNGPNRVCWVCGAMERHRSIWLFLDRNPQMLYARMTIVHIAPERVLRNRFRSLDGISYHGGDLTAEFGPEKIDVTRMTFAESTVDAVVCNHVLEHVPDDASALREIRRVLKPGGWAMLLVPGLEHASQGTDETPFLDDPDEQLRRFGQKDHVRRYGWDYLDRLRAAGLRAEVHNPEEYLDSTTLKLTRLAKFEKVEPVIIGRV